MKSSFSIGLAEVQVVGGTSVLECSNIGSGVAVVAYDPVGGFVGMGHFLLPQSFKDQVPVKPAKFIDTGLQHLIRAMVEQGSKTDDLVFAYAGGAQPFKMDAAVKNPTDIGARNSLAIQSALNDFDKQALATDVGGTCGRSVTADGASGLVSVRTFLLGEYVLIDFKNPSAEVAA